MADRGDTKSASNGAEASRPDVDLCVVTDATGSMGAFLESVRTTVPQFVNVSRLTKAFQRVAVGYVRFDLPRAKTVTSFPPQYRDYCYKEQEQHDWSDWSVSYAGLSYL